MALIKTLEARSGATAEYIRIRKSITVIDRPIGASEAMTCVVTLDVFKDSEARLAGKPPVFSTVYEDVKAGLTTADVYASVKAIPELTDAVDA